MKVALQYLSDEQGNMQAVQLPLSEWKKIVNKIKKYEQVLQLKSDLKEALQQVAFSKNYSGNKQTLNEFLNEL